MSSKRGQRRRACAGKKVYASVAHAWADARALAQRTGWAADAYVCPNCGAVHVGHRPVLNAPSPRAH